MAGTGHEKWHSGTQSEQHEQVLRTFAVEGKMDSVKATAREIMREIYRQENGFPERIIAVFLKCEEAGLINRTGEVLPRDRASLEVYARKLFHDGMSNGWIHRNQDSQPITIGLSNHSPGAAGPGRD
jgi:hypothetical protein